MLKFLNIIKRLNPVNDRGMTLTELIVATILMGIVMVGIAGFSLTVKQIQDSSSKGTVLAFQTAAAVSNIAHNAALAIGDINNPGIRYSTAGSYPYFSFRQDIANTPEDYSDDQWVIFHTFLNNTAELDTCIRTGVNLEDPNTAGKCSSSDKNYLVLLNNISSMTYSFQTTPGLYFDISITAMSNPASAFEPMNNPRYTLSTHVTPPAHSWN